ncbi:hypothetical protein [Ilumatobacter nonamiensis]|uniref:hypothetical protein n=1 Tax=Ilumatobacter nonamiensis TaxID=467093 RepID=UPI0011D1D567|nr:hypothetical protein [Ilumatobacter nonamiensis]
MAESNSDSGGGFTRDHVRSLHTLLLADPDRGFGREVAEHVADSAMRPAGRLALLARLKQNGAPEEVLDPIAKSLLHPDIRDAQDDAAQQAADDLIEFVQTGGADPLHRRGLDPPADAERRSEYDKIVARLDPELLRSSVSAYPQCEAQRHVVRGQPALFVTTEVWVRAEIGEFTTVVNPLMWPKCPIQSHFFKSMEIDDTTRKPLADPSVDEGWSALVTETVDFGPDLGLAGVPTGTKVTKLDTTFCTTRLDGEITAISATYSLAPGGSLGDEILYDEGYLLAERRDRGTEAITRLRTKKAVWFADKNTPANLVCGVWSFANALVSTDCQKSSMGGP